MSNEREKLFKQLRGLTQYKKKSSEELYTIVDKKLAEEKYKLDFDDVFEEPQEKKKAQKLAKKYLSQRNLEELSERNELIQLIWDEIVLDRVRRQTNEKCKKNDKYIPEDELKVIDELSKRIVNRKEKLGFFDKEKSESDGYLIIQKMIKRAQKFWEANQGTLSLWCPVRKSMCLLKIRTDKYDCQAHPFFQDRILTNKHLMRLYCQGKITKKDVAEILEVSLDYVDPWLIERWKNHPDYKKFIEKHKQSQ